MATVDNRIVQLEFKNSEFTRAISAALTALKTLDEALKNVGAENAFADITDDASTMKSRVGEAIKSATAALPALGAKAGQIAGRLGEAGAKMASALLPIGKSAEEATKKLQGISTGADFGKIEDSARRVNLAPIGAAADKVAARFTALQVVAATALSKITSKAIDTGTQMTKALSLDQVSAGFDEYELKLGSIQTIMAGSGEELAVVNRYLDELNTFADRTIYSFADMTQNIGKFTNAGVKLDDAVASIQGVALVAAVSGANTNEASRAMYNFAQALSKGYVQLIDWKSIELANLGTVEFKQQLIDAAEAAGTLTKQGDEWVTTAGTAVTAQKGFNDSLTDAWLTTEVLTATLGKYADETTEIGKKAFAAAQDVKTFSQLMDTLKEAIGSGFARSFEILIGDFNEAKALFTSINDVLSGFVDNSSEARNQLLQSFKDLGGRDVLIEALSKAFKNLGEILAPIREAFRDVFPPSTAKSLFEATQSFSNFVDKLKPSATTVENLKRIFTGFFSAIKIGIEFFKALGRTVVALGQSLGIGTGIYLEFAAGIADFVTGAAEGLVEGKKLAEFFSGFAKSTGDAASTAKDALGSIAEFAKKVWQTLQDIWTQIREWMSNFGDALAESINPNSFSASGEVVALGLFGAIAVALGKLVKNGLNIDSGGFMESLADALSELTDVLTAMQQNLKASALLKIAGALGILAAALIALSFIDAEALARATAAMTALMGQLLGMVKIITLIGGLGKSLLAGTTGMLLIAASLLLVAFAMKKVGELDIDAIGKGIYGLASSLTFLVLAINRINAGGGLVRAGLSMILMAISLRIMANALEAFARLNMKELETGLLGLAGSLGLLVLAINNVDTGGAIARASASMILMAIALNLISVAVKQFGKMNMDEIGRGLYSIASSLTLIAVGIALMPPNLLVTAAGILTVALALNLIAYAMQQFANMSMDEIGRGLYTLAASLTLLGVAMKAMQTSVAGAVATFVVAGALLVLSHALERFGNMDLYSLAKGLIVMAISLKILAKAGIAMVAGGKGLLIVGAALFLIGAAVALVGVGVLSLAKAFQILAEAGVGGIRTLIQGFKEFLRILPDIAIALVDFLVTLVEGLPALIGPLVELFSQVITALVELIPQVVEAIVVLVLNVLDALRELIPEFIAFGLEMLVAFLTGIRDNISEVTTLVVEIITAFIEGLTEGLPGFIEAVVDFFVTALTSVAEELGQLVPTLMPSIAGAFLDGFLQGLDQFFPGIRDWVMAMPGKILNWIKSGFGIFSPSRKMHQIGLDVIVGFLNGIVEAAIGLFRWFAELPGKIFGYFVGALTWLFNFGWDMLTGLLNGIVDGAIAVWNWFGDIASNITDFFTGAITWLFNIGWDILTGLLDGIIEGAKAVWNWFKDLPSKIIGAIPNPATMLVGIGGAIVGGLASGIRGAAGVVGGAIKGIGGGIIGGAKKVFSIFSPSRVFEEIGVQIVEGLALGISEDNSAYKAADDWTKGVIDKAVDNLTDDEVNKAFRQITDQLGSAMDGMDLSPTITPVVDLTQVEVGLKRVGDLSPSVSVGTAGTISESLDVDTEDDSEVATGGGLTFIQNVNSPTQLSETDVYKATRNQITLAREELDIP